MHKDIHNKKILLSLLNSMNSYLQLFWLNHFISPMVLCEGLKLANTCFFFSFIIAILVDMDWYLIWF